jgi:hypothetical protein
VKLYDIIVLEGLNLGEHPAKRITMDPIWQPGINCGLSNFEFAGVVRGNKSGAKTVQ